MAAVASADISLFDDFRFDRRGGVLFRRAQEGVFVPVAIGSRAAAFRRSRSCSSTPGVRSRTSPFFGCSNCSVAGGCGGVCARAGAPNAAAIVASSSHVRACVMPHSD